VDAERDWLARPSHDFLNAVAAHEPTPGGGSVAAAAGALAAAMARMVAAYSPQRTADDSTRAAVSRAAAELEQADLILRRLINEDAAAYLAYRAAKASGDAAAQTRATVLAIAVPMEIAAAACSVLRIMEREMNGWSRNLVSDLGVAAALAEACVRSAALNVRVNLKHAPQADPRGETRQEIDTLCLHAADLHQRLSQFVIDQLQ
jgi:glutamate formiminotransferase/formiminotetrahydrofolate cyclodeaminase